MATKLSVEQNKAIAILKQGFKKIRPQVIEGDIDELVKLTNKHKNTVADCINSKVRDFNTGSVVLTELKKLVADREAFAMELVA